MQALEPSRVIQLGRLAFYLNAGLRPSICTMPSSSTQAQASLLQPAGSPPAHTLASNFFNGPKNPHTNTGGDASIKISLSALLKVISQAQASGEWAAFSLSPASTPSNQPAAAPIPAHPIEELIIALRHPALPMSSVEPTPAAVEPTILVAEAPPGAAKPAEAPPSEPTRKRRQISEAELPSIHVPWGGMKPIIFSDDFQEFTAARYNGVATCDNMNDYHGPGRVRCVYSGDGSDCSGSSQATVEVEHKQQKQHAEGYLAGLDAATAAALSTVAQAVADATMMTAMATQETTHAAAAPAPANAAFTNSCATADGSTSAASMVAVATKAPQGVMLRPGEGYTAPLLMMQELQPQRLDLLHPRLCEHCPLAAQRETAAATAATLNAVTEALVGKAAAAAGAANAPSVVADGAVGMGGSPGEAWLSGGRGRYATWVRGGRVEESAANGGEQGGGKRDVRGGGGGGSSRRHGGSGAGDGRRRSGTGGGGDGDATKM